MPWVAASSEVDADQPQAELWFGAHVNGPSPLTTDATTLRDSVDPAQAPVLVKLLAAGSPLSIQIHPPADQAQASFAEQQADPSAPKLLSDDKAKTEMLIAVEPFAVFSGFRDSNEAAQVLRATAEGLDSIADDVEAGRTKEAIAAMLALPSDGLKAVTDRLPEAAQVVGLPELAVRALETVATQYPGDPGCLVATLLQPEQLNPGDAVYVQAGIVHAYIEGIGVEVMTASDNVLRLGLTPKTIAVEPALAAIDEQLQPQILRPQAATSDDGGTVRQYAPQGAPFAVSSINQGSLAAPAGDYRLVLAVDGPATVSTDDTEVVLAQGEAAAVLADEPAITVATTGTAYITRKAGE